MNNKLFNTFLAVIIVFLVCASLMIGYKLGIDVNETKVKKLEKDKSELIELLNEQSELNDIHSATIEDLTEQLRWLFEDRERQVEYNYETR